MRCGIICAIPQETEHLQQAMVSASCETIGSTKYRVGTLEGQDIVLASAGIGKVNTAMTATIMASQYQCNIIAFSGVAGGLDPALNIGDIVIADRTIQHDAGVLQDEKIQTYQAGHVPFFNPTDRLGYDLSQSRIDFLKESIKNLALKPLSEAAGGTGRPPEIAFGPILSGDQFLNCELTRRRLHQELGGKAIEMEGGALGQVCEAFSIEWLDIRALSDLAGASSHMDFGVFVEEVAESAALLMRKILQDLS